VAIDNLPARPADAPAAPPANPAVPEWLRPGAEIVKDADSTRSVGAAKTSGRVLGTAAGWLAAGTRGAGAAWWRYVRASDLIDSIEPRTPNEWDFIHGVRKKRWITCACTTGGGILGSLGAWIGTVAGMGMTAVPGLEAAGTMEGAAAMLAATITGRIITRRAVAELPAGEQPLALEGDVVTSGETLLDALTAIKVPEGARVVAHQPGPDGTSVTIVDLPPNFTVTSLKGKLEELAGALGRDTTMVDIRKAAHANQAAIWLSSADPFEVPRPSPLLTGNAAVDAWRYGVAVAWNKRGETILLPITNSNILIAGMTRSGKGVGAANLTVGASLDVRINLRVVAGKQNGEWDAYARAGVASTYFKPDPKRLLALLNALKAEKNRREAILGKLGKSKMTVDTIEKLGGIELLIVDELATYTRPGRPLRDEILEALIELSAVAAGAGILMVLITQYPEVAVIPQALAMNCGTKWAMRVDNATQSNAILGEGSSGAGRDASKFDPPRPGLGWLVNPFAAVTDLARSFDLDEDERGEISLLLERAVRLRDKAGRLVGQWQDPIETTLQQETGLSSAGGGPERNGVPGRLLHLLDPQDFAAHNALAECVYYMDALERDAQLEELAGKLGMPTERLSELLRRAGSGPTVKITHPERGRVNGYRRSDLKALLEKNEAA
jgi:S-DNA-T family DNA segregation ATPase FtsK/SpoIIIE